MAATASNVRFYIDSAISSTAELVNKDGGSDGVLQTSLVGFTGGYIEFLVSEPARYTLEIDSVEQDGCTEMYIGSSIASPTTSGIIVLDSYGNRGDSGKVISTDGTHADNSDSKVPTQKAVKTYSDTKVAKTVTINGNALSGNITLNQDDIGDGATYVQTQNALTDALKAKLDYITVTQAVDLDAMETSVASMLTASALVAKLVDGSANSNEVLKQIAASAIGNSRFAAQVAAQRVTVSGTGAASTVTPTTIGQIYVKTNTGNVYVSKGLNPATDWVTVS